MENGYLQLHVVGSLLLINHEKIYIFMFFKEHIHNLEKEVLNTVLCRLNSCIRSSEESSLRICVCSWVCDLKKLKSWISLFIGKIGIFFCLFPYFKSSNTQNQVYVFMVCRSFWGAHKNRGPPFPCELVIHYHSWIVLFIGVGCFFQGVLDHD